MVAAVIVLGIALAISLAGVGYLLVTKNKQAKGTKGVEENLENNRELERYRRLGTREEFEELKHLKEDCLLIGLKHREIMDLRNEGITVTFIREENRRLETAIKKKEQKISELEQEKVLKERELFVGESKIRELKEEKRGVIEELEKRDSELSVWGFNENLKEELTKLEIKNIPLLLNKMLELEKRLERWSVVANGEVLEVAEEKYRKSRERVEKLKGFSNNIKEAGDKFENWFYEGFRTLFGPYSQFGGIDCSPQDSGSDFVLTFDSDHSNCKVVVECKSTLEDDGMLYSISPEEDKEVVQSKSKKDQLEKGIAQLKKYLKKHEAQVGILVTSFDFEKEYSELKQDPKNLDPQIFVVKGEFVFQLLLLIQCVNKYSLPVEKPIIDIESIKDKEYELIPFLREISNHIKEVKKHHDRITKKSYDIQKDTEQFCKYSSKLKASWDLLADFVERKERFVDLWEGKQTPKLDSSVEVEEEEVKVLDSAEVVELLPEEKEEIKDSN